MKSDNELLTRYLDGALGPAETELLERRLASELELLDQLRTLRIIRTKLADARQDGFGPFFVDKAMKAVRGIRRPAAQPLHDALQWAFVRTAVAAFALVVILGTVNALDYQSLDIASTWLEAAFGLPSTTIEDAFSLGLM